MNPVRSILKNTSAYSFSNAVTTLSRVVLIFFISRWLAVEGLGAYSTAMSVFQVAVLFGRTGLVNYLPREIAKAPDSTNRLLMHAGTLITLIAVLLMATLAFLPTAASYSSQTSIAIYLMAIALIPGILVVILESVFLAHERMEFVAVVSLVDALGYISASILLLMMGFGVAAVVACFVIFRFVVAIVFIILIIRHITPLYWDFDFGYFKRMLVDIKAFVLISLQGAVFARPEILLLSFFTNDTQVGLFSAPLWLVSLWDIVPRSYTSVVFPVLTRAYTDNDAHRTELLQQRSIKYLAAMGWPITLGTFCAADKIIGVTFGLPEFAAAVVPLQIMAVIIALTFLNPMLWNILFARDEQRYALWAQQASLGIRGTGDVALIYPLSAMGLGYLGAAIAAVIGHVALAGTHLYFIFKDGTRLDIFKHTWRFIAASVIMGIFIVTLGQGLNIFLLVPAAAAIYAALVWVLRGFTADDIALLSQIWRRKPS